MEKNAGRTILKIVLGFIVVVVLGMSTLLVTAISTGKNPMHMLFPVDEQQAVSIVQAKVRGTVQEVEIPTSSNPVYEVEMNDGDTEMDVTVDARTGDVVAIEEDIPESETSMYTSNSPITEQEAKDIAVERTGGRVSDFEVKRRNGRIAYEVEITKNGNEADVLIDAETGDILDIEWEGEEEDDDD